MAENEIVKGDNGQPKFSFGGLGQLFGKFQAGSEGIFGALFETFNGIAEGTEINFEGMENTFEVEWDDTIVNEAHGAMSGIRTAVKTKGSAKGKTSLVGNLKRLFSPKGESAD